MITYNYNVPHGLACAAYLCDYLQFCPQNNVIELLNLFGYSSIDSLRDAIVKFSPKIVLSEEEKNIFTEQFIKSGKMNAHGHLDVEEIRKMW